MSGDEDRSSWLAVVRSGVGGAGRESGSGEGKFNVLGLGLVGGDIAVLACSGLGAGFRWDLYGSRMELNQ